MQGAARLVFIVLLRGPEQAKRTPCRASPNSIGAFGNVHFCDVQQIVFLVGPSRFFLNFGLSFYKSWIGYPFRESRRFSSGVG
jgi:hypothetical protein